MLMNDDDKEDPMASEYENMPQDTKKGSVKGSKIAREGPKWKAQGRAHATSVPPLHTQLLLYRAVGIISRAVHGRG